MKLFYRNDTNFVKLVTFTTKCPRRPTQEKNTGQTTVLILEARARRIINMICITATGQAIHDQIMPSCLSNSDSTSALDISGNNVSRTSAAVLLWESFSTAGSLSSNTAAIRSSALSSAIK